MEEKNENKEPNIAVKENENINNEKTETAKKTSKDEKFEQLKANSKKFQKNISEIEEKMTEKNTKNKMNKKKKIIITTVIIAAIIIIALIISTIFALININNTKIVSGVKIQGIDVSGLTQEALERRGRYDCQGRRAERT